MAWISLKDGWRDESSESPHTEALQTYYDWKTKDKWQIHRLHGERLFTLSCNHKKVRNKFSTIEAAKDYAKGPASQRLK